MERWATSEVRNRVSIFSLLDTLWQSMVAEFGERQKLEASNYEGRRLLASQRADASVISAWRQVRALNVGRTPKTLWML